MFRLIASSSHDKSVAPLRNVLSQTRRARRCVTFGDAPRRRSGRPSPRTTTTRKNSERLERRRVPTLGAGAAATGTRPRVAGVRRSSTRLFTNGSAGGPSASANARAARACSARRVLRDVSAMREASMARSPRRAAPRRARSRSRELTRLRTQLGKVDIKIKSSSKDISDLFENGRIEFECPPPPYPEVDGAAPAVKTSSEGSTQN
ncbi:hypothetical protein EVAR_53054_1 [Eumeta japonica]|uniref:Uncharacterized protein n=1 Tax=Eumeta variegata TaxID=151549 RepID=A0A4C1YSS0_EUMVA|nr:hypothetical protein EVAR_53054_1 [Eumeta japonica]